MKKLLAFTACLIVAALQYTFAQGIILNSGSNLVMNGSSNLVINDGGFTNNGTFIPASSTVKFTGTATTANTFISGTSATSLYNLGINKSLNGVRLLRSISLTNNLLLASGNIDLNSFNIDLGSTGNISGETATSTIIGDAGGNVVRVVNLNAPVAVNVGNIGIEITSTANLGLTTIKRGHQQQTNGASGFGIKRYYDIIPTNNTALNATVKMYYLDTELAGINESELKQWTSADNGVTWTLLGSDAQDATTNFVTKNNINQFNRLTLGSDINNALPVQLLYFKGEINNAGNLLTWSTSSEINNSYFDIERSFDGRNFAAFNKVQGNGTSSAAHIYSINDVKDFTGIIYYRLKQVNTDGKFTYSKIIALNKNKYSNTIVNVYPNPLVSGPVHIRFTSTAVVKSTLKITDVNGAALVSKVVYVQKGLNEIEYDLTSFKEGTYFITLIGIKDKAIKIIKRSVN